MSAVIGDVVIIVSFVIVFQVEYEDIELLTSPVIVNADLDVGSGSLVVMIGVSRRMKEMSSMAITSASLRGCRNP